MARIGSLRKVVIVGGESGPRARPIQPQWVRAIRDRCRARGVPFFFKQWGGVHKARAGRLLDGRAWDEMPLAARQSGGAPGTALGVAGRSMSRQDVNTLKAGGFSGGWGAAAGGGLRDGAGLPVGMARS